MSLDLIDSSNGQPDVVANELFKALAPVSIFGNKASTTAALTWGYYGGPWVDDYGVHVDIADGTVSLAASSTNYIEADENGNVTRNTVGFTAGRFPLYVVVTGASGITSDPDDKRAINGWTAGTGGGGPPTFGDQGANEFLAGPTIGSDDEPAFRFIVDADLPATVVHTDVQQAFTKNQRVTPATLTDAANISVDASLSNNFTVTLGGNRTLDNPSNLSNGMVLNFVIKQDGTGSRTLAYGTKYSFPGGTAPVLTTTASAKDFMSCYYDSAADELYCVMSKAFS